MKKFRESQRGDVAVAFAIALSIYVVFTCMSFIINTFLVFQYKSDLNYAAKEVMGVMRVENGADASSEKMFRNVLEDLGVNPDRVDFQATPKLVQRKDHLEIHYESTYPIWAFKLVGVPDYEVKVENTVPGIARKLIR